MRPSSFIAGISSEVDEIFDIKMPGLKVCASRSSSLSASIDRSGDIICDLQEWDDSLTFDISALDPRTCPTDIGPVVSKTT